MAIYLDYAAATPLAPSALAAMLPFLKEEYGNPSSIHQFGQRGRRAVDESREAVAEVFGCAPREVLFTSGGTESNNSIIFGVAQAHRNRGKHIVTTTIEHDSVLAPLAQLETWGYEVTRVPVGEDGIVKAEDIVKAVRPDTILVTVIYANNEIGTIQPIKEISRLLRRPAGLLAMTTPIFHTDACQATPYLSLNVKELGVDAMTINGSKVYGPKGIGALFVREGLEVTPLLFGGGQEYRRRSGTENVAGIVGLATALNLAQKNSAAESARLLPLRDALINGILKAIPHSRLNGDARLRLPNNVNISFGGLEGETILMRLDMLNVAVSSGSACTSGSLEPSHVIKALGLSDQWTHSATRFSLGNETTRADIDFVIEKLPAIIKELRESSPF